MCRALSSEFLTCDLCPTAARTKLKKMLKDEEAKKVAAAAKSAADRSSHAKEVRPPCSVASI